MGRFREGQARRCSILSVLVRVRGETVDALATAGSPPAARPTSPLSGETASFFSGGEYSAPERASTTEIPSPQEIRRMRLCHVSDRERIATVRRKCPRPGHLLAQYWTPRYRDRRTASGTTIEVGNGESSYRRAHRTRSDSTESRRAALKDVPILGRLSAAGRASNSPSSVVRHRAAYRSPARARRPREAVSPFAFRAIILSAERRREAVSPSADGQRDSGGFKTALGAIRIRLQETFL